MLRSKTSRTEDTKQLLPKHQIFELSKLQSQQAVPVSENEYDLFNCLVLRDDPVLQSFKYSRKTNFKHGLGVRSLVALDNEDNFHNLINVFQVTNSLVYQNIKEPNFDQISQAIEQVKLQREQGAPPQEESKDNYPSQNRAIAVQRCFEQVLNIAR